MNKIKGLFLTLFLVVFSVSTAFASTGTNDPPIIVQGKLIKHEELPETRALLSTKSQYADTYEYVIQPRGSGSFTEDGLDSSRTVHAYLTIYYSSTPYDGGMLYTLDRVSGYWDGPNSGVAITNATVRYICEDIRLSGKQNGSRTVTGSFDFNTGFSEGITDWAPGGLLGATLDMTLSRGGESWNFSLPNNYIHE